MCCSLTGTIPTTFSNNKNLAEVLLAHNDMEGDLYNFGTPLVQLAWCHADFVGWVLLAVLAWLLKDPTEDLQEASVVKSIAMPASTIKCQMCVGMRWRSNCMHGLASMAGAFVMSMHVFRPLPNVGSIYRGAGLMQLNM